MYKIITQKVETYKRLYTKIMWMMRLTTVILLAGLMQVTASTFGQQITLNRKNAQMEAVLKEIRKQSGYDFFYDGKILPNTKTINVSLKNADINDALATVLKGLPYTYQIEGKIVSIRKLEQAPTTEKTPLHIEHIDIRGRVTDYSGKPLAGATVKVKGTDIKLMTNENGEFFLKDINEKATIQITYLGYVQRDVKAKGDLGNIILELFTSDIEDVEVSYSTGYQNLSRERSAGSFAKPNVDIMKNRSSSVNVLQRLDGLVPGLTVNNAPSGSENPLLIRGLTSINSTRGPLVVVDGVELQGVSVESLNMQDIEDITVLKDASSSSIWGAKAANGVIVITTKKGRPGQKLRIDYDGYHNIQGRPDLNYLRRMDSREFIATARELFPQYADNYPWSSVESLSAVPPHLQIQYAVPRGLLSQQRADLMLDSLAGIDNRSQISDFIYRNAMTSNHTISLASGGPIHSFYGSVNYIGLQSTTPGEKDNRFKVNLRQDFNINRHLQLFLVTDLGSTRTAANNIVNLTSSGDTGYTPITLSTVPYQLLQDAQGNPLTVNYMGGYSDAYRMDYQARSRVNLDFVPLDEINRGRANGTGLSTRIVGGGKINLYKGLRFEGTYGYNVSSSNNRMVLDQESYVVRNELMTFTQAPTVNSTPVYNLPTNGGRLTENNALTKNWTIRNQLIYDLDWQQKHQLTILAGQEATSTTPLATQVIYRGWDDQLQVSRPVDYATLGLGITGVVRGGVATLDENFVSGGEGVIARTTSYYSNLNYSFSRKYTLNASWRIDESNLFGLDKSAQNRPVYSIGGKWALGLEEFVVKPNWLSELDLRFTYGVTGNAPTPGTASSYDILQAESEPNYVTGAGVIISSPANRRLTWEGTAVYNGGIDFGLLQGRLSGSIDGYIKNTQDLIGVLSTSPLTGFSGVTGNFGDLENKGVDVNLHSMNVIRENFFWSSGFTLGYNQNKITQLARTTPIATGDGMIQEDYVIDYPAFTLFGYDYAGLNAIGDPQITLADGTVTSEIDGNTPEDVLYMGTSQPIWSGGFSNNFVYKNFQLGINMSYNAGHKMFRDRNSFWSEPPYTNSIHPEFANRWKEAGDESKTNIPRYVGNSDDDYNRNTSYYTYANSNIFNASFLKLRDITLSYNLGEQVVRRLRAEAISFRFQVSNIMLWKANDLGIDPEFHAARGGRVIRTGQGQVTFGAHITL
ncbi:SusC/RagA family TonB-linked outer membrane protein [Sphingobacterium alkalisoli]|nr:SusC/RagA family TonB-linked outer membrane protein [Sphingobacterium alkalisoli]